MKAGGRQTISGYDNVRDFWQTKTEESFNKILTPSSSYKYMKLIGKYDRKSRPIKRNNKDEAYNFIKIDFSFFIVG